MCGSWSGIGTSWCACGPRSRLAKLRVWRGTANADVIHGNCLHPVSEKLAWRLDAIYSAIERDAPTHCADHPTTIISETYSRMHSFPPDNLPSPPEGQPDSFAATPPPGAAPA